MKRILSILLFLTLTLALPLQTGAETYDIADGDVTITAHEDGSQYSSRPTGSGDKRQEESGKGYRKSTDTVITGSTSGENGQYRYP